MYVFLVVWMVIAQWRDVEAVQPLDSQTSAGCRVMATVTMKDAVATANAAAVKAGGSCKAFSCAFFRAPNPFTSHEKTCSYKIAKTLRDLQNECSAEGATFDSWAQAYRTSGDLYRKFEPCTGHLIEEETKKVIKFCYCYNFCGTGQVYTGCEVDGLEGRLDKGASLFSYYRAMYVVCMFLFYCVRVLFYSLFA